MLTKEFPKDCRSNEEGPRTTEQPTRAKNSGHRKVSDGNRDEHL